MYINTKTIQYPFSNADLQCKIDYDGGSDPVYIGYAQPGQASSVSAWQIKKITYSGSDPTAIQFASGTNAYDKVWDDRAGYSYS